MPDNGPYRTPDLERVWLCWSSNWGWVPILDEEEAARWKRAGARVVEYVAADADNGPSVNDLAKAILSLADTAGMPDTFWQTDSRVALAREVLGVPEEGRYSHAHAATNDDEGQRTP